MPAAPSRPAHRTLHARRPAVWPSPHDTDIALHEHRRPRLDIYRAGTLHATITQPERGLLCATFSPDAVVYGKVASATWCVNLADASPRWRYTPPLGCHILELAYRPATADFAAIEFAYNPPTTRQALGFPPHGSRLIRLAPDTDTAAATPIPLPPDADPLAFADQGAMVVCRDGRGFETEEGEAVGSIRAIPH